MKKSSKYSKVALRFNTLNYTQKIKLCRAGTKINLLYHTVGCQIIGQGINVKLR